MYMVDRMFLDSYSETFELTQAMESRGCDHEGLVSERPVLQEVPILCPRKDCGKTGDGSREPISYLLWLTRA